MLKEFNLNASIEVPKNIKITASAAKPWEYAIYPSRASDQQEYQEKSPRRLRHELRSNLRSITTLERLQVCGRRLQRKNNPVIVAVKGGKASISGLQNCGSIWACPCCSASVRTRRALEIEKAVSRHLEAGGGAYFVTLTVSHRKGRPLNVLLKTVSEGFTNLLSGRSAQIFKEAFNVKGTIRTLEITHGLNGWHPHLHVLILTSSPTNAIEADLLTSFLWDKWNNYITRKGLWATRKAGIKVQEIKGKGKEFSRYLAKVQDDFGKERSLGLEMTRGDLKKGRRKGRTPFQVAEDAFEYGLSSDVAIWQEYEKATKGARAIVWSRGLKSSLIPDMAALTDEEIVNSSKGEEEETLEFSRVMTSYEASAVIYFDGWINILEAAEKSEEELDQIIKYYYLKFLVIYPLDC